MIKQERVSKFLRPRESASEPRTKPPMTQPKNRHDEGRPAMKELAHWRDQSEIIEVCAGWSQTHVFGERLQILA